MENTNTNTAAKNASSLNVTADRSDFVKKIGKTTYLVKIHFSETCKETMSEKIKRMLRNEVAQM